MKQNYGLIVHPFEFFLKKSAHAYLGRRIFLSLLAGKLRQIEQSAIRVTTYANLRPDLSPEEDLHKLWTGRESNQRKQTLNQ